MPADKNETYTVPGEVFLALTTGRTEFLDILARRVLCGEGIPLEQQSELFRLMKDLIKDRVEDRKKIQELENKMKDVVLNARGLEHSLDAIREGLKGLQSCG